MNIFKLSKQYNLIKKSFLFDEKYYLINNQDVLLSGMDPIWHFIKIGWLEGRNPQVLFDVVYYLENCSELKSLGMNPLLHFLDIGWKEGRNPHPIFDVKKYLHLNKDVRVAGINPLLHFICNGVFEKREPITIRDETMYNLIVSHSNRIATEKNIKSNKKRKKDKFLGSFLLNLLERQSSKTKNNDIKHSVVEPYDMLKS